MSDRPKPLMLRPEHVPQTLKDIPQWVGYRLEWDEGKQRYDKVPRVIRDGRALKIARTNVRDDWTTFDAVAAVSTTPARVGHVDGPGIVMTGDLGLISVDLDKCVTSGIISPEAQAILAEINSYSETSPSGTGIRIFVRATLPITKRVKDWIQVNASVGYLTVTGHHILGTPTTVEDRQAAVEAWFVKVFGSTGGTSAGGGSAVGAVRQSSSPILDDEELLGIARGAKNGNKFRKLYDEGDTSGYASESEAHLALVNVLVFYTHGDADQTQRLVLSSALGKHDKWQRPDYFARTLDRATLNREDWYSPQQVGADGFLRTELGNARRFAKSFGRNVGWVEAWKRWLKFTGSHWEIDDCRYTTRLMGGLTDALLTRAQEEEVKAGDDIEAIDRAKRDKSWAVKSQSAKAINSSLDLARSYLSIKPDVFDSDPMLLACPNGTVDLRTGELREARREDYLTKCCATEYWPDAKCPTWDGFLASVFDHDAELIAYVQRKLGYSLTGDVREQVLFLLWGDGSNGKSTLVETIARVKGKDFVKQTSHGFLMTRQFDQHTTEQADLRGMRLVISSETEDGGRLNESLIKRLTGGDSITARKMRADNFTFEPTHKIVLLTNYRPEIKGGDHAI